MNYAISVAEEARQKALQEGVQQGLQQAMLKVASEMKGKEILPKDCPGYRPYKRAD